MVLRSSVALIASLSLSSTFLSASVFAASASSSSAKDDAIEELVVVANRSEVPLRQVGSTVSILTEQELLNHQTSMLVDTLRSVPGVQVSRNGGLGAQTSVRIRGEEAHRTLLLIDGINVSDSSSTQISPRFEDLMSSQIERVEILRGPQGMAYGADAGGVVSLTSKTTKEPFLADLTAESGSYSTHTAGANVRGHTGAFGYSVSGTHLASDGFNSREVDAENEADGYENTTLHGRFDVKLNNQNSLELVVRDVDSRAEFDGCGWPSTMNCEGNSQQRAYRVALNSQYTDYQQALSYSTSTTERANTNLDAAALSLDSQGELSQFQYLGQYRLNSKLKFVFGADQKREYFLNKLNDEERERDNVGLFVDAQTSLTSNFFYTVGARFDDNEDFGEHTSIRVTGAYLIPASVGELKLKGSYGTGFRAPSLYEIGYNNGPYAGPDAPKAFREEKAAGLDFGLEWQLSGENYIEAVLFSTTIENEIYFDLAGFCCYLQDEGETESYGLELSGARELTQNVVVSANYTYNKTKLSENTTLSGAKGGDPRARRPKHLFNLAVETVWLDEKLALAMFYRNNSDSVDYPYGADAAVPLDDYQVLDMNARWHFSSELEAYLRASNVLDEKYQEINGYYSAGSTVYAGVRLSF